MCFFLGTHCGGRRCALPPAPPHPLLCFNRLPLLPTPTSFCHMRHLLGFILSLSISIETCVPLCFCVGTHCGGRRCALPPAPPHPLLCCKRLLLLPTLTSFLHMHRLFGFILSHCGGRRLHPSTRFHVLTGSGCSLLALLFSGSCYLALSSYVCFAYASFIWVHIIALRGEALRPPPCTPPPAFIF